MKFTNNSQVLFPLLENVKRRSTQVNSNGYVSNTSSSSSSTAHQLGGKNGNILMHHSRDTAEKQWAETRFLTLAGVVRVASIKRKTLRTLGDFMRAWTLLLEYIEDSALCQNDEVSLAALKSFQELLSISHEENNNRAPNEKSTDDKVNQLFSNSDKNFVETAQPTPLNLPGRSSLVNGDVVEDQPLWDIAWKVWTNIGLVATTPNATVAANRRSSLNNHNQLESLTVSVTTPVNHDSVYIPSQVSAALAAAAAAAVAAAAAFLLAFFTPISSHV